MSQKLKKVLIASAITSLFSSNSVLASNTYYGDKAIVGYGTAQVTGTQPYSVENPDEYDQIYGGFAWASGTQSEAKVTDIVLTISESHIASTVVGALARSDSGAAQVLRNYLNVSDSFVKTEAYAAQIDAFTGSLVGSENRLFAENTDGNEFLAVRFSLNDDNASYESIQGSNNTIELSGSTLGSSLVASGIAQAGKGSTINNAVEMTGNSVDLDNAQIGKLVSASALVSTTNLTINSIQSSNNTVTADKITAADVYTTNFTNLNGGSDDPVLISSVEMKNNALVISNSEAKYGIGAALVQENSGLSYNNVTNNIVRIKNVTVGENGVYGAASYDRTNNIDTFHGIDKGNSIIAEGINRAGTIGGFDHLSLIVGTDNYSTLTEGIQNSKAVITLTGDNHYVDLSNRTLSLGAADGFTMPQDGYFNLIHVEGNSTLIVPEKSKIVYEDTFSATTWDIVDGLEYKQGETFALSFEKTTSGETGGDTNEGGEENTLPIITPTEQKPTDNAKTLAENYLGSAALIGLGTEYIADEGLAMIVDSAKLPGKNVFGAIYGGTGKYHTGSRLDLDSATLITGISAMTEKQTMAISAFVEAGWGDSEGHVNQAHAKADHNVYSLGAAMRFFTDSPWYFDASARLGVARFDYTGNFATESVEFDHSGIYVALHGAVGYAYPITEDTTLDSYLRYSFTYLEGGSEKLHNRSEDSFKMDSISASAFRIGTRVKGYIGENQWLNYRVGAAYEKVVDGDANTKISGMSIDAPSLNGDTGIFEIGLAKRPTVQSPWGVDVTFKGYAGDRDGVYGSATVNYVF